MADRLKDYLKQKSFKPGDRIFPIGYEAARAIGRKAGNAVGVKLRPHDNRWHINIISQDLEFAQKLDRRAYISKYFDRCGTRLSL